MADPYDPHAIIQQIAIPYTEVMNRFAAATPGASFHALYDDDTRRGLDGVISLVAFLLAEIGDEGELGFPSDLFDRYRRNFERLLGDLLGCRRFLEEMIAVENTGVETHSDS